MTIFDRRILRLRRDRAAPDLRAHDFLFVAAAERLGDRLEDVRRDFSLGLDLGAHDGVMDRIVAGRGGVGTWVQADLSEGMMRAASGPRVVADEEFLPFAAHSFDLIVSCLSLHWVNDLPGALLQIRHALKPDGLFIASVFSTETLQELRSCLAEAELAEEGGLSPRCSPLIGVQDAGGLLQRAGFVEPVVDVENITVSYGDPMKLLTDLRGMGETNAVIERRKTFTRRATLFDGLRRYHDDFADADGRLPATFQLLTMTGWAPK